MKKLSVVRNNPARKAVAYEGVSNGCVYIPKSSKEGGGMYSADGTFMSVSYEAVPEGVWRNPSDYTPLYEGDQLVIIEEKVITLG